MLAREQVGQLEAALEGERQRHGEAIEALKAQHASELRQVRVQADSDRKHLMVQTDELRQAHRAQAAQLREQLAGERVAVETSRQQLNAAREAGARWQGRAEVAQQELAGAEIAGYSKPRGGSQVAGAGRCVAGGVSSCTPAGRWAQ